MRSSLLSLPILLLLFLCFSSTTFGQLKNGTVRARIIEAKTGEPVELANISIAIAKDSTIIRSSASDKTGLVEFSNVARGEYRLLISQLGLKTKRVSFILSATKPFADLGDIPMEPSIHNLTEVQISAEKPPVVIKKDTIEFNAGSYKTQQNDNVEQLLKKLPGIDIDKDGKITAQGKQVTKVLVDGKEFFGNDPKAATKNLPADAIDKVELIDDKTEHAKNTGIDDGQRDKVINIKLKEDKKHGWFGDASLAGGTNSRYLGQFNINHFDKKKQMSFFSLSNNVNESGFSQDDPTSGSGGGTGLNTSHSSGINYSDEWGKNGQLKLNSSVVATITSNALTTASNIQDAPNNLITDQNTLGDNSNSSYRLNLNLNYKPDTLNSFNFAPSVSITHSKNLSSKTFNSVDSIKQFINSGNQLLDQSGSTPSFSGRFAINHKFHRGKGSINFYTDGNYSGANSSYNNQSLTRYIRSGLPVDSAYNQQTSQDNNSATSSSTVSLVREISRKKQLSFNLSQKFDYRKSKADQATVQYNPVTGLYDIIAASASGDYDNETYTHTTTLGLSKAGENMNWTLNADVNDLGLRGEFLNNNRLSVVERNDWAITPNASFSYRKKMGYSLYVSAREYVSQPSINDLQPVFNNTNQLYIRQGNPDLKLSNTFNSIINYGKFDFKSNSLVYLSINFSQTWNGFSTASVIDPASGIQTSRPINTNGNFNVNLMSTVAKPSKIKGLNLIYGLGGQVSRNVNSVNNAENAVLRLSPSINLGLNFDNKMLQFGLRTSSNYNNAQNSVQHLADQKYFSFNNNLTLSVKPLKAMRLFGNLNQNIYTAQSNSPGQSVYLLNAGIERYFMKDNQLTLSLNGFDLLSQNSGLLRSISQTGQITNDQTNTIGQYFYLKLSYKINKLGGSKAIAGMPIMMMQ